MTPILALVLAFQPLLFMQGACLVIYSPSSSKDTLPFVLGKLVRINVYQEAKITNKAAAKAGAC